MRCSPALRKVRRLARSRPDAKFSRMSLHATSRQAARTSPWRASGATLFFRRGQRSLSLQGIGASCGNGDTRSIDLHLELPNAPGRVRIARVVAQDVVVARLGVDPL